MEEKDLLVTLNELLSYIFNPYRNISVEEYFIQHGRECNAKSRNRVFVNMILNESLKKKKIQDLIAQFNCAIKTVSLEWNCLLKESMSLGTFKYEDIVLEDWFSSKLRAYLSETTFIFIVFKKDIQKTYFSHFRIWKMPLGVLDTDVRGTWEHTRRIILDGNIVNYIDSRGRYRTNFLSKGETKCIHVRPHANNFHDTYPLPVEDKETGLLSFAKHSFWLNSTFIKKIVLDYDKS